MSMVSNEINGKKLGISEQITNELKNKIHTRERASTAATTTMIIANNTKKRKGEKIELAFECLLRNILPMCRVMFWN